MSLDKLQEMFCVESLHDDERAAEKNRSCSADVRGRMIERGGQEIGHTLAEPPESRIGLNDPRAVCQWLIRQWAKHPFRMASGARGIEHRKAQRLVRDRGRRKFGRRLIKVLDPIALSRTVDDEAEFHRRAIRERRQRDPASGFGRDENR
jgi:hypothetical protein